MTYTQLIRKSFEIKVPNIIFTKEVDEKKIKGIKHVICYGKLMNRNCGFLLDVNIRLSYPF